MFNDDHPFMINRENENQKRIQDDLFKAASYVAGLSQDLVLIDSNCQTSIHRGQCHRIMLETCELTELVAATYEFAQLKPYLGIVPVRLYRYGIISRMEDAKFAHLVEEVYGRHRSNPKIADAMSRVVHRCWKAPAAKIVNHDQLMVVEQRFRETIRMMDVDILLIENMSDICGHPTTEEALTWFINRLLPSIQDQGKTIMFSKFA